MKSNRTPRKKVKDKTLAWYVNGDLHREDGPPIIWYQNDLFHREDGPAITMDGHTFWYLCGKRHRADGPAVMWRNGAEEWWVNGFNVTDKITDWMAENNISKLYKEWTANDHVLFRLTF